MSQDNLRIAREFIKKKRYQDARDLLQTIDDPEAVELVLALETIELTDHIGEPSLKIDPALLDEWINKEKRLYQYGAVTLLVAAIYFLVADPFQTRNVVMDNPPAWTRQWLAIVPVLCLGCAIFFWWVKGKDAWIRRNLAQMQLGQLKTTLTMGIAVVLFSGFGVVITRNGVSLLSTVVLTLFCFVTWWRLKQLERLHASISGKR